MTKSILLSVRPEHAVNILNGDKTLELRKTIPKDFKGWVYIYVSKSGKNLYRMKNNFYRLTILSGLEILNATLVNGKVVGRFWLDEITNYSIEKWNDSEVIIPLNTLTVFKDTKQEFLRKTQLTFNEIWKYAKPNKKAPDKQRFVYAWHIKNLEVFDKPMELSEFYVYRQQTIYANDGLSFPPYADYIKHPLKRPPQSWQYVYVKE